MLKNKVLSYRVHLKVDQLPSGEGDDNLSLVHCAADNGFLARSLPLIHTLVRTDVANPVWVHLERESGRKVDGNSVIYHFLIPTENPAYFGSLLEKQQSEGSGYTRCFIM